MKKTAQTVIKEDKFYTITNAAGKVIEAVEAEGNGAAIQLASYDKKHTQMWAFAADGDNVYRIRNRATGKMMDLMMNGTVDGTWLHQWENTNGSSQLWILENDNEGAAKLKAQMNPAKVVDVVGNSTEDGARIQIWQDVNGENQKWVIAEVKERKSRATAKKAETAEGEAAAKKPAAKRTTKKAETAEGEAKPAKKTAAKKTTTAKKTTKKAADKAAE